MRFSNGRISHAIGPYLDAAYNIIMSISSAYRMEFLRFPFRRAIGAQAKCDGFVSNFPRFLALHRDQPWIARERRGWERTGKKGKEGFVDIIQWIVIDVSFVYVFRKEGGG
jgi:hypothetical protein